MTALHRVGRMHNHRSEHGLTLVELVASTALLALMAAVVGVAFDVGFKALGTGGAGNRLYGAHDQMVFEQVLGQDVARAACIHVVLAGTTHNYGSCSAGFATVSSNAATRCAGAALCIGWPQAAADWGSGATVSYTATTLTDSSKSWRVNQWSRATVSVGTTAAKVASNTATTLTLTGNWNTPAAGASYTLSVWTCRAASYASSNSKFSRLESSLAPDGTLTTFSNTRITTDTVVVGINPTTILAPSGGMWLASLTVTVTNTGVTSGQPTDTLILHPLASDPAGQSAAVTSSGPPC